MTPEDARKLLAELDAFEPQGLPPYLGCLRRIQDALERIALALESLELEHEARARILREDG